MLHECACVHVCVHVSMIIMTKEHTFFPYLVSVRSGSYVRPLCVFGRAQQSSFLVIHKVDIIAIFVQLLRGMNWQYLPKESILLQIYICHGVLN